VAQVFGTLKFEQFYNGHRPHQGIVNARPLQPLPVPLAAPDQNAFTYDDATDSVEYFMSINMLHELYGWGFRQGQGRLAPSLRQTRRIQKGIGAPLIRPVVLAGG